MFCSICLPVRAVVRLAVLATLLPLSAPLLLAQDKDAAAGSSGQAGSTSAEVAGSPQAVADTDAEQIRQKAEEKFEREQAGNYIKKRMEWFHDQRAFPGKRIPAGLRVKAIEQKRLKMAMDAARASSHGLSGPASQPVWTQIGPQPLNGFWGVNAGRVTSLAVDPNHPSTVYVGGAEGGVWKTTDSGANWTPLTDNQVTLAIGSLAIDPSNSNIVYAGTGELNFSLDSYYGAGILKSTDAGATWTHYPGGFTGGYCGGAWIGSIDVHPTNGQIVLAGVALCGADGVYRSADGGQTWSQVLPEPGGGPATVVTFDHTNGNIAYAALNGKGVYKSTDAGQTWTANNGTGPNTLPTTNVGRIAMAVAPSNTTTIYVGIADSSTSGLLGLYKTVDGGANWILQSGTPSYCGFQCWYDNVIAVSPVNANVVYAAGQAPYATGGSTALQSLDGGATWTDQTRTLHPDAHALAFTPDGSTLYNGNDAGVWSTSNPTAATVTWNDLNATLAITEFYPGISIDPNDVNHSYAGTQDNSTDKYSGSLTWKSVDCGDGGETLIDFATPSTIYTNCITATLDKSVNDGASFTSATTGINTSDRVYWVPPLTMDPNNSQTLYFGTYLVYQTTNGAGQWTPISPDLTTGSGVLSAIAVAPSDSNTVYVTSYDSQVYVSRNALSGASATWTKVSSTTQLPSRSATWVSVDPTTPTTAYVSFSSFSGFYDTNLGHVFKTIDAGAHWTDISSDLPNTPVNVMLVDPDSPSTIFIGTDIGMFYTTTGGTSWSVLGTGLPNVVVTGLALHNGSRTLRATTHGRSVWDLNIATLLAVPSITTISPTSVLAGSSSFTLTVNGIQFDSSCVVRWNGTALATTFVNSSQLTAVVPATNITTAGNESITVFSTTASAQSNAVTFAVDNPVATLTSLSPSTVVAGSAGFTLTVNGSNFISGASVLWNGSARTTTFVSSTQVTASIAASDFATAGTANVAVSNPAPGGGASATLPVTINNPVPALTSLSPGSVIAGGGSFNLTATGTKFVSTSQIRWNGTALSTHYISSTQVSATVPSSYITVAGTSSITVSNPNPGGGTSSAVTFTINNPAPKMTSMWQSTATVNGPAFTLNVAGSSFVHTSVIKWKGTALTTTYVSSSKLTATVPASDLLLAGTVSVNVFSPTPGGGNSSSFTFTINDPFPYIGAPSPSTATAGGPAFTLTVNGTNFVTNSVFKWKGVTLPFTYVSPSKLTVTIPASDIATAGTATFTVTNPAPGGGTSAAHSYTINNPSPAITTLSPASALTGGLAFTLTVNGSNFVSTSSVAWKGSALVTTYVSPNKLTAHVPGSDLATAGSAYIQVTNPSPGGGTSPSVNFAINNALPVMGSISPSSATAGGASFTITANGSGFVSNSKIQWKSTALTTTFVGTTRLTATIPASYIALAGTAPVVVTTPGPGGGTSAAATFTINNPAPTLASLSPSSVTKGAPGFTLTLTGTNFVSSSVVKWKGVALGTSYVNSGTLTAHVPGSDVATSGPAAVTVTNPSPGGGTSTAVNFTVN